MRPVIACLANLLRGEGGEFSTHEVLNRPYVDALLAAGAVPFVIPCLNDAEALAQLLAPAQGLLLTGGADVAPAVYGQQPHRHLGGVSPWRDQADRHAVAYLQAHPELPVLGICRGLQSLAAFAGGTLIQDLPAQVPDCLQHSQQAPGFAGHHEIRISPGSRLAQIVGDDRTMVNSFHHQAVEQAPGGFVPSAHTADGVIEALERTTGAFCLGVQFHPELMAAHHPPMAALFRAFVEACGG